MFEKIPTFNKFLKVAKQSGRVVIFDVVEPPVGHAYHKIYVNITLEAILQSGIEHSKVYACTPHTFPTLTPSPCTGLVATLAK